MKILKSLVAMTALTVSATSSLAYVTGQIYDGKAGLNFGFMHTDPNCRNTEGGIQHKPTFCTMEDSAEVTEKSGMVAAINRQLEYALQSPSTARVSVAYFSFSNKGVQKKLCELSSKGISIRIFLDGGSQSTIDQVSKDLMKNPECFDSSGQSNIFASYLGGSTSGEQGGIWQLHHNKFLMIDPGNGKDVKLNFSSGNLSSFGTALHLDHWVTIEAPASSNLIRAHKCIMDGLEAANKKLKQTGKGLEAAQSYIATREQCFTAQQVIPRAGNGPTMSQIRSALKGEEIAPLFSPNNDDYVAKALISSIYNLKKGDYMYIAIQHFLHQGVAAALTQASNAGVDVRIVMDDDIHAGESEVKGVDQMVAQIESQAPAVQIRYAETNHYAGGNGQMMHNKLAILNGEMTFSGAGHYTGAALRKNWENFYFVTNRGIVTEYAKYFKSLWDNSVDKTYARTKGKVQGSAPSELKKRFLDLAQ